MFSFIIFVQAFGLHESANIIKNENKAQCLFDRLLQAVSDKVTTLINLNS